MHLISGIDVSASALNAQRTRLDVVAQNIANAHTTRGADGRPYQRQMVSFETELVRKSDGSALQAIRVGGITRDTTPGQQVNDPQHPDADAEGMLELSNVSVPLEMVELGAAARAVVHDAGQLGIGQRRDGVAVHRGDHARADDAEAVAGAGRRVLCHLLDSS